MNKVTRICLIIFGIVLLVGMYYFLFFNNSNTNNQSNLVQDINTYQDVYVNDVNIDAIDCNNDNLEEVIYIKDNRLICLNINNEYTWVSQDKNVTLDVNIEDVRSDLISQKVYAFAGQRCSNRNVNKTGEDKTTGEILTCVDKGNSVYMWESLSQPDNTPDDNTSVSPEDNSSNSNSINVGDECTLFQEFQQYINPISNEQLVCLMSEGVYTWQLSSSPQGTSEEELLEPSIELVYEGAPCDISLEFQMSPDVNNPGVMLRCLFSDSNYIWIKEE